VGGEGKRWGRQGEGKRRIERRGSNEMKGAGKEGRGGRQER
jgi:hypothetical protein